MNAMDRIDAVISVIGTPWKHSGMPLQFSSLLSQSCEQYHCQQEAKTCADGAEQGFHVVISICDILDRNTQYCTVSRDQRQDIHPANCRAEACISSASFLPAVPEMRLPG